MLYVAMLRMPRCRNDTRLLVSMSTPPKSKIKFFVVFFFRVLFGKTHGVMSELFCKSLLKEVAVRNRPEGEGVVYTIGV